MFTVNVVFVTLNLVKVSETSTRPPETSTHDFPYRLEVHG